MPHIGNEPGDRGYSVRQPERPVDDLHHPVVILREPVVARLELLDGHILRPHDDRASRVIRVVGADDPALPLKFPVELRPRIGDQDVDGDAVDLDLLQGLDGPVKHVRRVRVEPKDDPSIHQDAAVVEPRDVVLEALDFIETLIRLGQRISGNGLDPHEDAETPRLCGQGEQFLVFCKEHMGLHKELLTIRDHRREKLSCEGLVCREIVVQEGDEPVAGPL